MRLILKVWLCTKIPDPVKKKLSKRHFHFNVYQCHAKCNMISPSCGRPDKHRLIRWRKNCQNDIFFWMYTSVMQNAIWYRQVVAGPISTDWLIMVVADVLVQIGTRSSTSIMLILLWLQHLMNLTLWPWSPLSPEIKRDTKLWCVLLPPITKTPPDYWHPGLNLGLRPDNEGRRYNVTPSLIGWAQT